MKRSLVAVPLVVVIAVGLTGCIPPNLRTAAEELVVDDAMPEALTELAREVHTIGGATVTPTYRAAAGEVPPLAALTLDVTAGTTPQQQAALTEAALEGLDDPVFADAATVVELRAGELPFVSLSEFAGTPAEAAARVLYLAQLVEATGAVLHAEIYGDVDGLVTTGEPAGDASRAILGNYAAVLALRDPAPDGWEWVLPGISGSRLPSAELAALLTTLSASIPLAGDEFTYDAGITIGVSSGNTGSALNLRVDDAFTRWSDIVAVVRAALPTTAVGFTSWDGATAHFSLEPCATGLITSDTDIAYVDRLLESGVVLPATAAAGICGT